MPVPVTLKSGLIQGAFPSDAQLDGHIYIADGRNLTQEYAGVSNVTSDAGYTGPVAAPTTADGAAGVVTAGVHNVTYRYVNEEASGAGYVSKRAPLKSHTAGGSKKLDVGVIVSPDARVTAIVVEMTLAGGTTFFEAGRFANATATVVVDISDATLGGGGNNLLWPETGHDLPPVGKVLRAQRSRVMVAHPREITAGNFTSLSGTITFTGVTLTDFLIGRGPMGAFWFQRDGDIKAYQIASVNTGAGTITTNPTYPDDHPTAQTYRIFSRETSAVFYSLAGFPESYPGIEQGNPVQVLRELSDRVAALEPHPAGTLVYGEHSMELFQWWDDPLSLNVNHNIISKTRGAVNPRVVQEYEGKWYAFDRLGFHLSLGGRPTPIDAFIRPLLKNIDYNQSEKFHALIDLDDRLYVCFVVETGDTQPQTAFVYSIDEGYWKTYKFDKGITASTWRAVDKNNFQRMMVGDEFGHTWFFARGTTDGVRPSTTSQGTVTGAPSATVVQISEGGLDTTGQGLAGVPAYNFTKDELAVIDSNTADTVTLKGSGFATTPAVGDTLMFGRIHMQLRTKNFRPAHPNYKQMPWGLHLRFPPLPTQRFMYVKLHENQSGNPVTDWETGESGVNAEVDTTSRVKVDLSDVTGRSRVGLGSRYDYDVFFQLDIFDPDTPIKISDLIVQSDDDDLDTAGET